MARMAKGARIRVSASMTTSLIASSPASARAEDRATTARMLRKFVLMWFVLYLYLYLFCFVLFCFCCLFVFVLFLFSSLSVCFQFLFLFFVVVVVIV